MTNARKKIQPSFLLAVAVLLSVFPLMAEPNELVVADDRERYIIVLGPGAGQKPDVAAAGGTIEHEWGNRIEVKVPPQAVQGLRNHPRVKYMQRVTPSDSGFAPAPSPTPAPGSGKESSTSRATASDAGVAPAATWNWTTGIYSYDGAGNITGMGPDTFGYDTLSRLTASTIHPNGLQKIETYSYDAAGNMIARNNNGLNISMPVNILTNRLSGATYDGAGNMTSQGTHGTHFYTWDAVKMMARLSDTGGKQFDYVYTADDERIATKDIGPGIWRWTIRGFDGKVLREYESPSNNPGAAWLWTEDYIYRDGQLAGAEREAAEGGRRHFHLDHLGTPRLITSATGERIATHTYYPFGVEATPLLQETTLGYDREDPMKFTGHERDHVGGTLAENVNYVDYMHARHYSPNLGRFLSPDPIDGTPGVPQSWNRYAYVLNNPINFTDPTGMECEGGIRECPQPSLSTHDYLYNLFHWDMAEWLNSRSSFVRVARNYYEYRRDQATLAGDDLQAALYDVLLENLAESDADLYGDLLTAAVFAGRGPKGIRNKPGSSGKRKGTDALRRENKVVRDVSKELKLSKSQQQLLHREISGQGYNYHQVREIGMDIKAHGR